MNQRQLACREHRELHTRHYAPFITFEAVNLLLNQCREIISGNYGALTTLMRVKRAHLSSVAEFLEFY